MFPEAIRSSSSRRKWSIPNTWRNPCGRLPISRERTMVRAGSRPRASHDERPINMKYRFIFLFAVLAISTVLYGQGRGPAAFNIDLAGMWTPPLHEDALERGNGPELADYGGFA